MALAVQTVRAIRRSLRLDCSAGHGLAGMVSVVPGIAVNRRLNAGKGMRRGMLPPVAARRCWSIHSRGAGRTTAGRAAEAFNVALYR